jgi:hypothetical protein
MAGAVVAGLHLALIGYAVACIFFANEQDWPMYWMFFFLIDTPMAALWIAAFVVSSITHWRRGLAVSRAAEPTGQSRGVPVYIWMVAASAGVATLLAVASLLRIPLGPAGDGPNFQLPLAVFGGLGTFVYADTVRRVVWLVCAWLGRTQAPRVNIMTPGSD